MTKLSILLYLSILSSLLVSYRANDETNNDPYNYGVDVTYPVHHYIEQDSFFKQRYEKIIQGCYDKFSQRLCSATEGARLEMNRNQPSQHYNYTEVGFKKGKIPEGIYQEILDFWEEHKEADRKDERWARGNTYVNSWETTTYMVNIEDKHLRGATVLKKRIQDAIKPVHIICYNTTHMCLIIHTYTLPYILIYSM